MKRNKIELTAKSMAVSRLCQDIAEKIFGGGTLVQDAIIEFTDAPWADSAFEGGIFARIKFRIEDSSLSVDAPKSCVLDLIRQNADLPAFSTEVNLVKEHSGPWRPLREPFHVTCMSERATLIPFEEGLVIVKNEFVQHQAVHRFQTKVSAGSQN